MRFSRRTLLLTPVALARAQAAPPLVVMAAEGHGWHLGTLGTPALRTPRLDALAEQGALYRNAYAASALPDLRPEVAITAVQPKETYLAAREAFAQKPGVTVVTLDRAAQFANARAAVEVAAVRVPPAWPDLPVVREEWARYLMFVQCLDALAGAVLDAVERAGWGEEALVVYASTLGPAARRPLLDLALHVPLIVRGPGVAPGTQPVDLVSLADLPRPAKRELVAYENERGRSVFDGRFRYVKNKQPGVVPPLPRGWEEARTAYPQHGRWLTAPVAAEELYDHAADPEELRNVAGDAAYRNALAKLAGR